MELHDDDKPVGRVLTRREVLALLGGAGAAVLTATAFKPLSFAQTSTATPAAEVTDMPSCIVRPAETEGPYFVDEMLNRYDIRIDPSDSSIKDGIPLHLKFRVSSIGDSCEPLAGAQVDIWHCDALGVYSDVNDPGFNTVGQKWLRGYQVTDENGIADFLTIYPGWYQGRTVHIHFKIRTDPASDTGYEFTSQLFFDDSLSDQVFTLDPYSAKGPDRGTRNNNDGIFSDQLILDVKEATADDLATAVATAQATMQPTATAQPISRDGYSAVFDIGLDLSQPAQESGPGGGAPPGGGRPPGGGNPPGNPNATATPSA